MTSDIRSEIPSGAQRNLRMHQRGEDLGQQPRRPPKRFGHHPSVRRARGHHRRCRPRSPAPIRSGSLVSLPRKSGKERHYLSHIQVQLLADESRNNGTLIRFLGYTGLRWGEAVGLRVKSLDLRRRPVLVRANAVNVRGTIIPGTTKSHEARRVPFPAFLADPLAVRAAGKGRNPLLFGHGEDYQPTPTPQNGWFAGAPKRSCLQDLTFPDKLRLHDLRHTAASLAISAGANLKAVQRMLGHAAAAMTLDTYADLFDDDLDALAVALDEVKALSTR